MTNYLLIISKWISTISSEQLALRNSRGFNCSRLVPKFAAFILLLAFHCSLFTFNVNAQDVIPKPKTKAEKKAERKGMTLEQKIESIAPVDVTLPSARVKLGKRTISNQKDLENLKNDLPSSRKEAQKTIEDITSVEDAKKFVSETLPDLGLKVKRKAKKAKDIAKKAAAVFDGKQYEGIAIEKHVIKRGSGNNLRYTELYTSKKNTQETNPYIRNIFWFEEKRQRVVEALARSRDANQLMHGPYSEYRGENLVEEGFYYLGTKHGRWVKYGKDEEVLEKTTYYRGFLDNSTISYYDTDSTKIKEVIPNWYGKQTGDYFVFYEAGTLAIQGQLDNGVKVGKWVEYYPTGNRRKKETQYGGDCFDESEPYVIREYDEGGKIIYQKQ